jgi:hypothetical protein
MAKKWIGEMDMKKGALHKALGVASDKKIPAKKLAVKSSDSPLMRKRKSLAKTLRGFD